MIVLPFAIRVDWDIQTIEVERRESQLAGIEGTGGIQLNPWNGYAPEGKTLALAPFLAVAFKARVGSAGNKARRRQGQQQKVESGWSASGFFQDKLSGAV